MAKKTNGDIISYMVDKTNCKKQVAEQFVDALTNTIVEMLKEDGSAVVDELGTFKTVKMAKRESVNVNNGERIVIPEYTKITFHPSDNNISINVTSKRQDKKSEKIKADAHDNKTDDKQDELVELGGISRKENQVNEKENVLSVSEPNDLSNVGNISNDNIVLEKPVDEFSGIDVLISTPESLSDMKVRLDEERERRDKAQDDILKAQEELNRVKDKLKMAQDEKDKADNKIKSLTETIANIENNIPAEIEQVEDLEDDKGVGIIAEDDNERNVSNKTMPKNRKLIWPIALATAAIIALVIIFIASPKKTQGLPKDNGGEQMTVEKSVAVDNNITHDHKTSPDESKANPNETKVDKVVFDGLTPFEIIVQKHYGNRSHLKEVLDYNYEHEAFQDWRKIPVGAEILLPVFEK